MTKNVLASDAAACGFLGLNVLMEYPEPAVAYQDLEPIVNEQGQFLRFALAACDDARRLADVNAKLAANEPLIIGTAYPRTAKYWLWELGIAPVIPKDYVQSGGIEALPRQFPAIDAVFELVQTGESLRENNLRLLEDNLVGITLVKVEKATAAQVSYNGGQDGTIDSTL